MPRNQIFCLKNWKNDELFHTFFRCSAFFFFFILFRFWVICQNKKRPWFYMLTKTRFINNSRAKQNKKRPWFYMFTKTRFINNSRAKQNKKKSQTPICRNWLVWNVCEMSMKNITFYGDWSSSKSSTIQANNLVSQ